MTTIAHFRTDCRGQTAVLFGLLMLPVMASAGAALDYTRAASARTAMQAAADAAALTAARDAPGLSPSQVAERARAVFMANFNVRGVKLGAITVQKTDRAVTVAATGAIKTSIMGIVRVDTIDIGTTAEAAWGRNKLEIALVLDNTGSMGESGKMPALKSAVRDFLTALERYAYQRDAVKVSIIPFDTQVNIGTAYVDATWLTFDADLPRASRVEGRDWRGCISDRNMPYDTRDDSASSRDTLYPAAKCSDKALVRLRPLTSDFAALRRTVDGMQPSGFTNITVGTVWGLNALNAGGPIGGGVVRGTPGVEKIMVILTDGDNTRNRYTSDPRRIDERTCLACKTVKDADVRVHTIRVIEGNARLLRACASAPETYHEVSRASELTAVFRKIVGDITNIRLAR